MISAWTKHLKDPAEIEKFKGSLFSSKQIFRRLNEIILEEEKKFDRKEFNETIFETPNWPYLQAYFNGFRACLEMFKKLINLDPKET